MPQFSLTNFPQGLTTNPLAFNIDNKAFTYLYNAYVWRGRVKRKRGTTFKGQLSRPLQLALSPNNWQVPALVLIANATNLLTGLETTASVVPFSILLTDTTTSFIYSDPLKNGTIFVNKGSGAALDPGSSINYSTGALVIAGGGAHSLIGSYIYYPGLPVMGLPDFISPGTGIGTGAAFPQLIAFDTTYAHQCNQAAGVAFFFNISYYKTTNTPFTWHGQDYQQFFTANYPNTTPAQSGAFWATNNVAGFHYLPIGIISSAMGVTTITFTQTTPPTYFQTGDWVFFYEIMTNVPTYDTLLNGKSFQITTIFMSNNSFTVAVDTSAETLSGGIFQFLTTSLASVPAQDGIRWYDGDPTNKTGIPVTTATGWVNFSPPLIDPTVNILSQTIAGLPQGVYYLVGALMIVPFQDRLMFLSPWVQSTSVGPVQLQDTIIWSWTGTPFYALPVPNNQTADPHAYITNQVGLGGYLPAGISEPIATVGNNEDVLLIGFGGTGRQTRFAPTGDDIDPFLFYSINSELPSSATFSSVTLDKGKVDIGSYGITMTDQQSAQRIDLQIPDSVFKIQLQNSGNQRVNAIRDYYREWIYFCYPVNNSQGPQGGGDPASQLIKFPTETFLFNYRDNTWAVLYENFTAHGYYRASVSRTWANVGFPTWNAWREPWNAGITSALATQVIAGNPQGYVLVKSEGTFEAISGTINAVATHPDGTLITSYNHCVQANNPQLEFGDYLYFLNGVNADQTPLFLNTKIGLVINVVDANNFVVDIPYVASTYIGLGNYTRLSQPYIQTKQFNLFWDEGRQTRIGVQRYLLTATTTAQVTVQIFLSQDPNDPWSSPNSPTLNPPPNGLVYSEVLYTCRESTNLGLTPANTNLQSILPLTATQQQIWHRSNTSLQGDTFQIGITLEDNQMKVLEYATAEIELHAINFNVEKGPDLA
jgi:hypothetical protein